jgi:hypothetical protein
MKYLLLKAIRPQVTFGMSIRDFTKQLNDDGVSFIESDHNFYVTAETIELMADFCDKAHINDGIVVEYSGTYGMTATTETSYTEVAE